MACLYQNPKFQENRTGRNPTNWVQSWPVDLKIWAATGKGCPSPFLNHSQRRCPYILRRLALQLIIQSAATRSLWTKETALQGRTQHFAHLEKCGLHADQTAGRRW